MLTKKQEKFVQELVKGKSQREAYKSAYNTAKMKDETIDSCASRVFKKDEVTARYNELMKKSVEKTEYEATEVRKEIIIQLMKILQADISTYFRYVGGKRGSAKAYLKNLTEIDTKPIQSLTTDKDGKVVLKLYDKLNAIRELKDIFGLVEQQTDDKNVITINVPKEYIE